MFWQHLYLRSLLILWPQGLFDVDTLLGSFGGCLPCLPGPHFSVLSLSCLEAKGCLDIELDSLISPLYGAVRVTGYNGLLGEG